MPRYFNKSLSLLLLTELFILLLLGKVSFADEKRGSVTGTVRYFGTSPPRESASVQINPEICGSNYLEENLVNFENKGVKNAIISLKKKTEAVKRIEPEKRIYLISKRCLFEPYVTAIQIENSLSIENKDPIPHEIIFEKDDKALINVPLPAHGHLVKKIDETGLIQIKCAIHPFMRSYIVVLDTPIYLHTDQDGSFRFPEIEAGKYRLAIWHKAFGSIEKEIEVEPGRNLNLKFEMEQK